MTRAGYTGTPCTSPVVASWRSGAYRGRRRSCFAWLQLSRGTLMKFWRVIVAALLIVGGVLPAVGAESGVAVSALPLIERAAEVGGTTLVVMFSGDGGWSKLTEKVTVELNAAGYPVVGWNTLKYFWKAKTPEQAAGDLAVVIDRFSSAWRTQDVILVGYSMGADVLPGIVNRLPDAQLQRIRSLVLLAPERATDYEFHFGGWLKHVPKAALPVAPELARVPAAIAVMCIYGVEEADRSLCTEPEANRAAITVIPLPGGHHFDGDYAALARHVRE